MLNITITTTGLSNFQYMNKLTKIPFQRAKNTWVWFQGYVSAYRQDVRAPGFCIKG